MATTKAQQNAVNKYIKNNYDSLRIVVPKGRKSDIETHAKSKGESINGYINGLVRADMGMTESEWKAAPEE